MLELYENLLADVRYDRRYHPIKQLVQPGDPDVREIARILAAADDPISAAHQFVHSFTSYAAEVGDYWETPAETLSRRAADCDGSAILLASLLRNYLPPDKVYVGIGLWERNGESTGHAWVIVPGRDGQDKILESTGDWNDRTVGVYKLEALFNDLYAFATQRGLHDFDLMPV